jgi:hypothetical protein
MELIAKKICQFNGQKGTQKQIEKILKSFKNDINLMMQFCNNRIKL